METLHKLELDWIAAFQGDGGLQPIMLWISSFGWELSAYLMATVYFGVSRSAGTRLYLLYSLTIPVISISKLVFHLPRPYWVDLRIDALSSSRNYGMPSGHVLAASVLWGSLAKTIGKPWGWGIAGCVILLVSISRVYLGVHFISDVIGAWAIAAAVWWGFRRAELAFGGWLQSLSLSLQITVAFCAAAVVLIIAFAARWAVDGSVDPTAWSSHSTRARDVDGLVRSVGAFFGAAGGIALARHWARFAVPAALWKRVAAVAYALAGAWLIREFARTVPAQHTVEGRLLVNIVAGGAVSNVWMLFACPWILMRMGLLDGTGVTTRPRIVMSSTVSGEVR